MHPKTYMQHIIIAIVIIVIQLFLIVQFDMYVLLRSLIGVFIGLLSLGYALFLFTLGVRLYLLKRPEEAPKKTTFDYINLALGVMINPVLIYFLLIGIYNYFITILSAIVE